MSDHAVKGWCPTAWRPMMAGDGLLVRVRPLLARLTRDQIMGLCTLALRFGNGLIDVTNRANLQIRGVTHAGWPILLDGLVRLEMVDRDATVEARRAILVTPDWQKGDQSEQIAIALTDRLHILPELPGKIGFAVDAGPAPQLGKSSADFRIERSDSGGLLLRADGRDMGMPVSIEGAADAMVALAHWFVDTGGPSAGRMARHSAPLPTWALGHGRPLASRPSISPGPHSLGHAYGIPFGSMQASALEALMICSGAEALRVTPWRTLLLEDAAPVTAEGFVNEADHQAMRADACPGAPACLQASVDTRALATRLAPLVSGRLHVSGCVKGCAHAGPADVTLTGRTGLFDLAFRARAGDPPIRSGLDPDQLLAHFGAD